MSNKIELFAQFLRSTNEGEAVKACERVVDKILEALPTDRREAFSLNKTLTVSGPRNTLAIPKAPKAAKAPKAPKALEASTTPIDPETRKAIVEFISSFRILERRGTPPPDGSPDPLHGGSPEKRQNLSPAAIERLVTVCTKIQSLDNRELEQFLKLYDPAKGGSLKALWEPYIKPAGADNWVIIRNLADVLDAGKNAVGRRLMKSVLSETLDNEVERLKKEGYKPKKGQRFRALAREMACPLGGERLKLNDIAGQKWSRLEPGVLIGLCNLDSSMMLVFNYLY